jgi:N-acetylglucosaminyl-diphospho-decaprenol L-rhamnosyltransferase
MSFPAGKAPRVSIVIVSWNARDRLVRTLRGLDPTVHQVIVVDNASGDGSAEAAAAVSPRIEVLPLSSNRGFAGAVNAGAARATGPMLLLLNPDAAPERGALDQLATALDAEPRYAAVCGQLIDEHGQAQTGFTFRRFPTLAAWAADLLLLDQVWPDNPATRRYLARDLDPARRQDVDQPAAACLLIRRSAFDAVGGMDDAFYPAWFEDVDFCRRLRNAGWRLGYVPAARIVHEGGVAMRGMGLNAFSRAWYRNMLRYARKHHGPLTRVALRALIAIGMMLRAFVSLACGRPADARAYGAVLADVFTARTHTEAQISQG